MMSRPMMAPPIMVQQQPIVKYVYMYEQADGSLASTPPKVQVQKAVTALKESQYTSYTEPAINDLVIEMATQKLLKATK